MKLTCDVCDSPLEMNGGGRGATCTQCGLTYSLERLKEKMRDQSAVRAAEEVVYDIPEEDIIYEVAEEDVVYDVDNYEVVDTLLCSPMAPRDMIRTALNNLVGDRAIFPDAKLGLASSDTVDFLVRAEGYDLAVFLLVKSHEDQIAYRQAVEKGKLWESRGAYWFVVFEDYCTGPEIVTRFIREAMEKARR